MSLPYLVIDRTYSAGIPVVKNRPLKQGENKYILIFQDENKYRQFDHCKYHIKESYFKWRETFKVPIVLS